MTSDGDHEQLLVKQTRMIEQLHDELLDVRRDLVPKVGEIRARLNELPEQVARLESRLGKVEGLVARVLEQQVLNESLAQARDERARLEKRLKDEFAGRNEIRRLAISLISAPGSAAVRDRVIESETIVDTAGRHMLKDADYWLAAAVVAVAAEQTGQREVSPAAWSLSATSDPVKSDLFLSLFYSRLGRHDAAAMSMNRYLEGLDPQCLGREFSHVINALAEGELGEVARSYAQEALSRWGERLSTVRESGATYAAQASVCRDQLLIFQEPLPANFPTLRRYAAEQWSELEQNWRYAIACQQTATAFHERLLDPVPPRRHLAPHAHSQRALRALIEQPEPDEIELLRGIRAQDLIVQCGGDRARAESRAQKLGDPFAETLDLASFLTQASFQPEAYGLSAEAQRFTVACATNWIMEAARSVVGEAERLSPATVEYRWDKWIGKIDADAPRAEETERVTEEVCGYIATARRVRRPSAMNVVGLVVGAVITAYALLDNRGLYNWTLLALGVAVAAYSAWQMASYPKRRARMAKQSASEQREAKETIPMLVHESVALLDLWRATVGDGLNELAAVLARLSAPRLG